MKDVMQTWARSTWVALGVMAATVSGPTASAQPAGTGFTYQGRLTDSGTAANGAYDFQFSLHSAAVGGSQVGPVKSLDEVAVVDGLFTVVVDFGPGAFPGDVRFLEIGVRPGSASGAYTLLGARQELTPSPHAVFSQEAPWSGVGGKPAGFADDTDDDLLGGLVCAPGQVAKWNGIAWACADDGSASYTAGAGLDLIGTTFSVADLGVTTSKLADGSVNSSKIADASVALTDLGQNGCASNQVIKWNGTGWVCAADVAGLDWALSGNAATVPGTHFLGTTDAVPLEMRVGSARAVRLEPNGTSPNLIGGYGGNSVTSGAVGVVIGGGGNFLASINTVTDDWGTVAGGSDNRAGNNAGTTVDTRFDTVGGGRGNTASGGSSTVGGGSANTASGQNATVGGGSGNTAGVTFTTIAGGINNAASALADTVGGGSGNSATGGSSVVAGGISNLASGTQSAIGGGNLNVASGTHSTVPGGTRATASLHGQLAHAAGMFAASGDAQTSVYVLRNGSIGTTQVELFLDGIVSRLTLANGRSMTFDVLIVGRSNAGESAGYSVQGVIENVGGTVAFVPAAPPTVAVMGEDDSAWSAVVEADNVNDALVMRVTGNTGDTIRWVARVRTVEVAF